jgi:hypothetical protein
MRARAALSILILGLSAAACDPCAGVVSCERGAYLAVDGQIVDPVTGAGIEGVRIDVVRTAGLPLVMDSASTTTEDEGHWRLELAPTEAGAVVVDVVVSPPGYTPYRVRGLTLESRPHAGDANVLERWVREPYFAYAGELFHAGTEDDRVQGAAVEFRRTGGVELRGPGIGSGAYRTVTDVGGRFALFPFTNDAIFPVTFGDVLGDLFVDLGPPVGIAVIRGIRLSATQVYHQPPAIYRLAIGPANR